MMDHEHCHRPLDFEMAAATTQVRLETLIEWVQDARARTCDLVADLTDEQLIGPKLPIVNPLLWEIGHAAWFQEKWVLRHCGGFEPLRPGLDSLYDSIAIEHDIRWDLPLLPRDQVMQYIAQVGERAVDLLASAQLTDELAYFVQLSVFHEDMHTEAFSYTRQTLAYPEPRFSNDFCQHNPADVSSTDTVGTAEERVRAIDADVAGGSLQLGASPQAPFAFDNEQWEHSVDVRPFAIARTAVTQGEFVEFVADDGYRRRKLWCEDGWRWREQAEAEHPVYWRRETGGRWLRRDFERWLPLEPNRAVLHVNWYEAQAFCRWADRRLPTEAEWELAASATVSANGDKPSDEKRKFPWGDEQPTPTHANLDWSAMGAVDVTECSAGDSAYGCRQMIGNVWEWTDTTFQPYPGFAAGPYKEYSVPCFGECKVLRGGCWTTRGRLLRNTWRNFYRPDRRDVWVGFRTCALDTA